MSVGPLPFPKVAVKEWWTQGAFRRYCEQTVRYYSDRWTYTFAFEPGCGTAYVQHAPARRVALNPDWGEIPWFDWRRGPRGGTAELETFLLGVLAHEAGHVVHSYDKPPGVVGHVWNCLEDEREERLQAALYPELEGVFDYLGDLLIAAGIHRGGGWNGSSQEGVLAWRFFHDHDDLTWTPQNPAEWARVKPLVEASWTARDSHEVQRLAREIVKLLGLPEDAPDDLEVPVPVSSSGAGAPPADNDGVSEASGNADEPGRVSASPYGESDLTLFPEVERFARDLAEALQPPRRSRLPRPDPSRGSFDVGRYLSGEERFYLRESEAAKPYALVVLHDVSHSMGRASEATSWQHAALRASGAFQRAAELARLDFHLWAFNGEAHPIADPSMHPIEQRRALRCLTSSGGTALAPALAEGLAVKGKRIIVILSDGGITDEDECQGLLRGANTFCVVPVLLGLNDLAYRALFGRALVVENKAVLAQNLSRWLRQTVKYA